LETHVAWPQIISPYQKSPRIAYLKVERPYDPIIGGMGPIEPALLPV